LFQQGFMCRARSCWQLFSPQCVATIFCNIEQIYDLSSQLLNDMDETCRKAGPYNSQMGACFLKYVRTFAYYHNVSFETRIRHTHCSCLRIRLSCLIVLFLHACCIKKLTDYSFQVCSPYCCWPALCHAY